MKITVDLREIKYTVLLVTVIVERSVSFFFEPLNGLLPSRIRLLAPHRPSVKTRDLELRMVFQQIRCVLCVWDVA